jgi:hypothetical protein
MCRFVARHNVIDGNNPFPARPTEAADSQQTSGLCDTTKDPAIVSWLSIDAAVRSTAG